MAILKIYTDSIGQGACRSCHAPLIWVEQVNGLRHPLNGSPLDLVAVQIETEGGIGGREIQHIDTSINTSHFATCPRAADHRRRN